MAGARICAAVGVPDPAHTKVQPSAAPGREFGQLGDQVDALVALVKTTDKQNRVPLPRLGQVFIGVDQRRRGREEDGFSTGRAHERPGEVADIGDDVGPLEREAVERVEATPGFIAVRRRDSPHAPAGGRRDRGRSEARMNCPQNIAPPESLRQGAHLPDPLDGAGPTDRLERLGLDTELVERGIDRGAVALNAASVAQLGREQPDLHAADSNCRFARN